MDRKFLVRVLLTAFITLLGVTAFAESHVRIVRLSYIEGSVQIDRGTGQYEAAIVNLPITEGAKLRTGDDGRAEVEFEDGSTLRLASNAVVAFPHLSLSDSGTKLSAVELNSGTAYVDWNGPNSSALSVELGQERLQFTRSARVRIGEDHDASTVAVFKGEVQVVEPSGTTELKKNQTATFAGSTGNAVTISKGIQPEPLDPWEKQQDQYHDRYASNSYRNYSPYAYGTADLGYYGSFFSAPGYGMLWQPYLIGAGWDPFMDGAWAFSPGFGFGWVSAYPWGWVPYHYGTWIFVPGYGWAWQPGGTWMAWYSQPAVLNAPSGFKPPQPPAKGGGTSIVTVNRGPASTIAGRAGNKMIVRNNSAGLGVPRGSVSNLAAVSRNVERHGPVTTSVQQSSSTRPGPTVRGGSAPPHHSEGSRAPEPRMSMPQPGPPPPSSPRPHK